MLIFIPQNALFLTNKAVILVNSQLLCEKQALWMSAIARVQPVPGGQPNDLAKTQTLVQINTWIPANSYFEFLASDSLSYSKSQSRSWD